MIFGKKIGYSGSHGEASLRLNDEQRRRWAAREQ
jgi:hypothetical protein